MVAFIRVVAMRVLCEGFVVALDQVEPSVIKTIPDSFASRMHVS